jgi:RNA polymerase sigma factor (sigma-70 family)
MPAKKIDRDSRSYYSADIAPYRQLLTKEDEIQLSNTMKEGLEQAAAARAKLEELNWAFPATDEEAAPLLREIAAGERKWKRARDTFIMHNVRMVNKLSWKYQSRGLDLEDIVSHGNMGLMTAVDKFDPTRGFRFSTYAWAWIRQSIGRGIHDEGLTVRIPVHTREKMTKLYRVEAQLRAQGIEPTDEAVAREGVKLNWHQEPDDEDLEELAEIAAEGEEAANSDEEKAATPADSQKAKRVRKAPKQTPFEKVLGLVRKLRSASIFLHTESFERPLSEDDDDGSVGDMIAGPESWRPDVIVERKLSDEAVREMLDDFVESERLTEREARILRLRFGIGTGDGLTLEEVGQQYEVTRERIRQLEAKALRMLSKGEGKRRAQAIDGRGPVVALQPLLLTDAAKGTEGDTEPPVRTTVVTVSGKLSRKPQPASPAAAAKPETAAQPTRTEKRAEREFKIPDNPCAGIPAEVLAQRLFDRLTSKGLKSQPVEELAAAMGDPDWMTERELFVLCLSWGLCGEGSRTGNEIAKILGVTPSTIGQLRTKAHDKLWRYAQR